MFHPEIHEIVNALHSIGGDCYLVGGGVRDIRCGQTPKDFDIEVYKVHADLIIDVLNGFGKVDIVGMSFGVIKLKSHSGMDYDFSLPRRENKVGQGHKGFMTEVDPNMTLAEASSRRDYTMNSMMYSFRSDSIVDLFNGAEHFDNKILCHTSVAFSEDALRVLRGMQFAGRFGMIVGQDTASLCNQLRDEYRFLAKERIWGEWYKWATKSVYPSAGLRFLRDTGWIELYPELNVMTGVRQDPVYHPEIFLEEHIDQVVDHSVVVCDRENVTGDDRAVIVFAALCHDMAKPFTTEFIDGRIRSHGHEKAGGKPTRSFLESIGCPESIIERVIPLVENHLAHAQANTEKAVRRLAVRLGKATIRELCFVIEADASGRHPLPRGLPESAQKMLDLASETGSMTGSVDRILLGRHLIELGMKPGKIFTVILNAAYDAQLDGVFNDLSGSIDFVNNEDF